MNSESNTSKQVFRQVDSAKHLNEVDTPDLDEEDPYSWNGPSNALLGFAIAIVSIGVPLLVVFFEKPPENDQTTISVLEPYGSKLNPPFSLSRFSKPSR